MFGGNYFGRPYFGQTYAPTTTPVSQTAGLAYEAGATLAATRSDPWEALRALAATASDPWEALQSIRVTVPSLLGASFPTNPVLDNFNRANENPLSGGGNWFNPHLGGTDNLRVVSNAVQATAAGGQSCYGSVMTDCEVYATMSTFGSSGGGLMARTANISSGQTFTGYWLFLSNAGSNNLVLYRVGIGQVLTTLFQGTVTPTAGDKLGLRCVGSTIEVWYFDSGSWSKIASVTDATWPSGYVGLLSGSAAPVLDDFGGGSLNGIFWEANLGVAQSNGDPWEALLKLAATSGTASYEALQTVCVVSTFGNPALDTVATGLSADLKHGLKATLPRDAVVIKLTARTNGSAGSGSQDLRMGIYADSAGSPGALLAQSVTVTQQKADPVGADFWLPSPLSLAAGDYWLVIQGGATGNIRSIRLANSGGVSIGPDVDAFSDGLSNPYGSGVVGTTNYDLTATYVNRPESKMPYEATRAVATTKSEAWEALLGIGASRSDPWEANRVLAATRSDPFEANLALAATRSDSWEALLGLAATRSDPYEAEQGISATRQDPYEALRALAATSSDPWESLLAVAATRSDPWEANLGIAATRLDPLEALLGIAATRSDPLEALLALAATRSDPFETLLAVAAVASAPWEALLGISATRSDPFEALRALRTTASEPFEALQGIFSAVVDDEFGASANTGRGITGPGGTQAKIGEPFRPVASGYLAYVECAIAKVNAPSDNVVCDIYADVGGFPGGASLATASLGAAGLAVNATATRFSFGSPPALSASQTYWIVLSRSGSFDSVNRVVWDRRAAGGTNGARYDDGGAGWVLLSEVFRFRAAIVPSSPYEATGGLSASRSDPWESLLGISSTRQDPVEALQGIRATGGAPFEALLALAANASDPWEALLAIAKAGGAPWEALLGISAARSNPWESSSVTVSSTAVLPYEALVALAANPSLPYEALVEVAKPSPAPWEANLGIAATRSLPFSSLGGISAAALAPWEALLSLAASQPDPWEALAALAASGVLPYEALARLAALGILPWEANATTSFSVGNTASLPWDAVAGLSVFARLPWEAGSTRPSGGRGGSGMSDAEYRRLLKRLGALHEEMSDEEIVLSAAALRALGLL